MSTLQAQTLANPKCNLPKITSGVPLMLPAILVCMKQGGYREVGGGFTLVETMIVLAVTGVLFVSAAVLINGKQNRTQFTTAINGFQQQMQQLVNETANGFYPQKTAFSCSRGASAPPLLTAQALGDHQGQNPDCIFMGKVIQFAVIGTDPQLYTIFPIIGNRLDTTNATEASTLYGTTGAFPEAAAAGSSALTNSSLQGAETTSNLAQGLRVVSMWYGTNTANTTGTVGFLSTLPSPDGSGVVSGSQHLALYTVASTALNQTKAQIVDAIYPGVVTSQPLVAVNSVSVCLASGSTNQSGLITIGANDASAATSVAINLSIKAGQVC